MRENSLRVLIALDSEYQQVFKALIGHPMDDGYRVNAPAVEANYIKKVAVFVDDVVCLTMDWNENVSKNPFISFRLFRPLLDGQILTVSWRDNRAQEISYDFVVTFNPYGRFVFRSDEHANPESRREPEMQKKAACKNRHRP